MQHSTSRPNFPVRNSHSSPSESGVVRTRQRPVRNVDSPPQADRHSQSGERIALDSIQLELQQVLRDAHGESVLVQKIVELTSQLTNAIWCGYFDQTADRQLNCVAEKNLVADQNLGFARSSLLPAAGATIDTSKSRVATTGELTVITTPIFACAGSSVQASSCLCIALNLKQESPQPFLLMTQMIAASLSQWHERNRAAVLDWQIDSTTAIAELMSKVVSTHGSRKSALVATNELATFLKARLVAIGFCQTENSKRTRLQSVSGATEVDLGGKQSTLLQSALNETLIRGTLTTLPDSGGDDRCMKLAHKKLLESHPDCRLVSSPLTTTSGETIGAWICLLPDDAQQQGRLSRFASVTSSYLADALDASKRASLGPAARVKSQARQFYQGRVGRAILVVATLVGLVMMVPVSHRVSCDCQLKPTVRRFAVAPHDGILLESFVKPGDMVEPGQLLARMDDRELRLQLLDLVAQQETALKKRDVHRSARDAAATQIAELEIDQLDAQIELVTFKKNSLDIKSAVAGVVLQGDLEDAQGAPVRTGDVLIEIAPLEELRLELRVPEADVAYVKANQSVTVVLEGVPFETLGGHIVSIRPMSEVYENRNVFVSEFPIANDGQLLRPGMQGRAKVTTGWRSIGWVLFHRPAERVFSIFR